MDEKEKSTVVGVRISSEGLAYIDRKRGSWSRPEYIRQALARASKTDLEGPKKEEVAF